MSKFEVTIILCLVALSYADLVLIHHLNDASRIVGGEIAAPGQFPWQVLLRYNGSFTCGGSILNFQWIVTAAHCIEYRQTELLSVLVGTVNANGLEGVNYNISFAKKHEEYGNFVNDIALLKTDRYITFSHTVQSIKIAETVPEPEADHVISGWGRTKSNSTVSPVLRFTVAQLTTWQICAYRTSIFHPSVICFWNSKEEAGRVCSGDSGGPSVFYNNGEPELIGLASFVIGGCGSGNPDGFTKVSYFSSWILNVIRQNL